MFTSEDFANLIMNAVTTEDDVKHIVENPDITLHKDLFTLSYKEMNFIQKVKLLDSEMKSWKYSYFKQFITDPIDFTHFVKMCLFQEPFYIEFKGESKNRSDVPNFYVHVPKWAIKQKKFDGIAGYINKCAAEHLVKGRLNQMMGLFEQD